MTLDTGLKHQLLTNKLIVKNTVISLLGAILPLIIGVIAIPKTINLLGDEVFGLLVIVWAILSYMSLLDLGLGKALVKYISESIGKNETRKIQDYFWVSVITSISFSVILSIFLYASSNFIALNILKVENDLLEISSKAIRLIAFGIPLIFLISIYNSFFRSIQRFGLITFTQVTNSIFNYLLPVIVYSIVPNFNTVVLSLVIFKLVVVVILSSQVFKSLNTFPKRKMEFVSIFKELINFGWWANLSSLIGPLIDYLDRFTIASVISLTAVAYYSTPLEIVLRVSFISVAITSVVYSAISNSINHDSKRTEEIINNGLKFILICILPIICTFVLFAKEGLNFWVGEEFAENGFFVVQIVGIGIIFKSMTYLPISHLQSLGKPSVVAKIHLFEVPIYMLLLYSLSINFGLMGVAVAHCFRLIMDYMLMTIFAKRNSKDLDIHYVRYFIIILSISLLLAFFIQFEEIQFRLIFWLIIALVYVSVIIIESLKLLRSKKLFTKSI